MVGEFVNDAQSSTTGRLVVRDRQVGYVGVIICHVHLQDVVVEVDPDVQGVAGVADGVTDPFRR